MGDSDRKELVVGTLRFLAAGWVQGEDNQRWLASVANRIERTEPSYWWTCPLCEETTCDSYCPLAPLRSA